MNIVIYVTSNYLVIHDSFYLSGNYQAISRWIRVSHLVKNCPIKCKDLEKISDIYWYHLKES